MEDGQATAGLELEPQGRDSSFAHHREMQGRELNPQHRVRMLLELLSCTLFSCLYVPRMPVIPF